MGAEQFESYENEPDVAKAFSLCVKRAQYDYGHAGYTGTIAEKDDYVIIQKEPVTRKAAYELAETLLAEDDVRINTKWGPAGAIPVGVGKIDGWYFFGWASS